MLSKIIYASRASRALAAAELESLLRVCNNNNRALDVTGLLVYCDGSFLQLLEGEGEGLDGLYDRIRVDDRHDGLRLLTRGALTRRRFAEWSMAFEHVDAERLADLLPGYRTPVDAPLVDAGLIHNGAMADALLGRFQRRGAPGAGYAV